MYLFLWQVSRNLFKYTAWLNSIETCIFSSQCIDVYALFLIKRHWLDWSTKFNFCFVPQTSIDELNSMFYAEFRYVCRIFLSGRVSKIQRNLNVQNSTLRAHETGRNFPLKCWGLWLSPVFGARYIPLQCPAIVYQHTWGPFALVLLFDCHNVLLKSFTVFVTDFPEIFWKKI